MLSTHLARLQCHPVQGKKRAFIPYGFHVGFYLVKDTTQAKQEGLGQLKFIFQTCQFHKHDPKGLVLQHDSQVSSCWSYAHDKFEDEIFIENAHDWDEVVQRMANPKMTRFRALSLDEQVMTIELLDQEALRAGEETRAAKEIEVPLVALMHNNGFPMTPEARERGLIMIEQAQQVIDQLQNIPDLVVMKRVLVDNPDESRAGPSGLEIIQIDEIVGLDDPEVTTP
jgi:hypothetical protein